jgi:imidazolonepropionase-like amidohydrolase
LPRTEVLKSTDIIRSATLIGTEYIRREGALGVIVPGTISYILVVDGNPLEDLKTLTDQGAYMPIIMKDGAFVKNALES